MKIRDGHAKLNSDPTTYTMPSGSVEILGDDDRALFSISLEKDGSIRVAAGTGRVFNGVHYDDAIAIRPGAIKCRAR
jgi:hypothetical protein